jgi:hypothetical protein
VNMRAIDRRARRDRKRNRSRRFPRRRRRLCRYCEARTVWTVRAKSAWCHGCGCGWVLTSEFLRAVRAA